MYSRFGSARMCLATFRNSFTFIAPALLSNN
jgi:hypothetical protein